MDVRESCLACIEKHLGAAWVLLHEEISGYDRRLLIIGHLHEAEAEAQDWPELAKAIQQARHRYQMRGKAPSFARLQSMIRKAQLP